MEWKSSATFVNAPLQRVLRRVADDASVDATIDVVSSFATGEQLQLLRAVKDERNKLQSVLQVVQGLLADAEHKGCLHSVGSWLAELRDAVLDAEDVLDEYATDAAVLHRQWDKQSAGHREMSESEVWIYFSEKLNAYRFDKIRGRLEDTVENGKELGLQVIEVPHSQPDAALAGGSASEREPDSQLDKIRFSYEQLAPNLKECFAYCSLFRQDYEFNNDELARLWMAEGFIEPVSEELPMEYWGRRHLERLLSASLMERKKQLSVEDLGLGTAYISDGEAYDLDKYVMNDLTRDLAASVSSDYGFMPAAEMEGKIIPDDVRHLSLDLSDYMPESLPVDAICSHDKLRTLLLSGPQGFSIEWASSIERFVQFLEEVVFMKLRRLRVFRLQSCILPFEMPTSIDNLRHLRLLDLSYTPLRHLPESVGNLYNLQVLNLEGNFYLEKLPERLFCNLTNLRSLNLSASAIVELPESLGDACNLQVLDLAVCQSLEMLPESLGNLTNLVELRAGSTEIKRVPDGIGNLTKLRILRMSATMEELPESFGELRDLQVLSLAGGSALKKLPESFSNLTNLTHLNLAKSGLQELPDCIYYNFPKLQEINLTGLEESLADLGNELMKKLVNEKGVLLYYYGKQTSIPDRPQEEADDEAADE